MNWEKAKTLTLIFLLLINVFLAVLVYYAGRKYTLSAAQEAAINKYMSRNNVSLNSAIPRNFRPMAALRMQAFEYSATVLALAFFGSTENVMPIPNFHGGQTAFSRGGQMLVVDGNRFIYENTAPTDGFVLTLDNAIEICEKFVSMHENVLGKHVIDRYMIRETWDGFSITFNGKFRNRLITSNTLVFHVTESGISRVAGVYNEPVGIMGEAREIISPDEALYLFVKRMNYIYVDQEVIVNSMDIVYHLAQVTTDSSIPLNAVPYYLFTFNNEAQVMINAYTGAVF